jgi:F-type H+-transporting ATPase subunit delta
LEKKLIKKVGDSIGKKITIINSIDKNILGGMILKIDSLMIDFSIRSKLNNYKISMKGEV